MGDKIYTHFFIAGLGNIMSELNLTGIFDDHANWTKGNKLICGGKWEHVLTPEQEADLHNRIAPSSLFALNLSHQIELPSGTESPLQTQCSMFGSKRGTQAR